MAGTKPQASEASAARPPSMARAVSIMSLCSLEKTKDPETSGYTATGSLPLDRAAGGGLGANEELSSSLPSKGDGKPAVHEIPREGQKESKGTF